MALTRIKTNNILDRQVFSNDLAEGAVTFTKIQITGTASAGDVLKVDGFGNLLFEPATGTSTNLNALTDVEIVSPQNFDSLVYNSSTGNWEASSKTSSSVSLASLSDTAFVFPLQQNQYLRWDGAVWVHSFITADQIIGLGDQEFTSVIDQMADVDTTTVTPIGGDALVWNGIDNWVPLAIAGVGASSNTYVVDDIAARDALTPSEGDSVFVRTGSSGEYEQYVYDAAWILLATQDSARSDANTMEAVVFFNSSTPVLVGNVSNTTDAGGQGTRITNITIEIVDPFDGNIINLPNPTAPAFFNVGDSTVNDRLIDDNSIEWDVAGSYVCNLDIIYDGTDPVGTTDVDIFAYFDFTGSTVGEARIIVTHV